MTIFINRLKTQHMNLKNGINLLGAIFMIAGIQACDHNRNNPGWQYSDDMVKSPAYETYTQNPNFKDGETMQPTIEGTIPRGFMKYPYQKNDEDRVKAGLTLKNPFEPTTANLEQGKTEFKVYCAMCHGDKGDGQGRLFTSKKFPYPPANLLSDKVRTVSEGEIYHVISVGWGIMAEHGSMINPDDRWKIVLYIENVLQKN